MKVAILAPRIWETIHLDQAHALARSGHEVFVYTEDNCALSASGFSIRHEDKVEFWVIHGERRNPWVWLFDRLAKPWLGRRFFTSLVAVMRFLYRHRDADLVMVEGDWVGVFAAIAGKFISFTWVVTVHDTLNLPFSLQYAGRQVSRWRAALKMWVLSRANWVRANSYVTRDALCEAGCDPTKIRVVPLHVLDRMRLEEVPQLSAWRQQCAREIRHRYGISRESFLMVTMCRLTPVKGLELAIEALAATEAPDMYLMICGGDRNIPGLGSYRDHLQSLAARLGVGSRVIFTGDVPLGDVRHYMAAADIHLAPSWMDTFNYAVIEATLCGTPSLMSRHVGAGPWVVGFGAGIVEQTRDPGGWALHIARLMALPVHDRISKDAGMHCLEQLNPDRNMREFLRAFIAEKLE